jgi:hypothetical protein
MINNNKNMKEIEDIIWKGLLPVLTILTHTHTKTSDCVYTMQNCTTASKAGTPSI